MKVIDVIINDMLHRALDLMEDCTGIRYIVYGDGFVLYVAPDQMDDMVYDFLEKPVEDFSRLTICTQDLH